MKKIILFFIVLAQTAMFAQKTHIIEKPLKLIKAERGIKNDSLLVWAGPSKLVKHLPVSEIKGTTNLDFLATPMGGTIFSSTGNDVVVPLATTINAGLLSPSEKIELNSNILHKTGDEEKNGQLSVRTDDTIALIGRSNSRIGVYGRSDSSYGVFGRSNLSYGVYGESSSNFGVYGHSYSSIGVFGNSGSSTGVYARSHKSKGLEVLNYFDNTSNLAQFGIDYSPELTVIDYQGNILAPKFVTKNGTDSQYVSGTGDLGNFDNFSRNIIKDVTPSIAVTGTISETLVKTYLIPANTFKTEDVMYIKDFSLYEPIGDNQIHIFRLRIGPVNNFASSSIIMEGGLNLTTSLNTVQLKASHFINNSNITSVLSSTTSNGYVARLKITYIPFDPTVDNYLFSSIQLKSITSLVSQIALVITN